MDNSYYRILNLDGSWFNKIENKFIFNTTEDRKYKNKYGKEITVKPNKNKLYSATLPESLETYRAFIKLPEEVREEDEEQFTDLFINLKFKKDHFDDEEDDTTIRTNKKKLRTLVYSSTVLIDGIEYCFFKRGASKARTANVIFVKKQYYEELYKPCLLGLQFEEDEEYDVTSLEAYVSLIMSGIIGTIEIKSDEILIINDLKSPTFKVKQTVTKINDDDNIYQDNGEFDVVNDMTDGQALIDENICMTNELLNESTCVLLRNDFFKANAVRTRLQDFYKENNIDYVWDMYRGWIDASKIRLVITPSACKYLKFSDQFESKEECFLNWLKHIPSTFGVVKIDNHIGNYGYSNRLSYQMINSMNLSSDEMKSLIADELKYYKYLKDNVQTTSEDIRKMTTKKSKAANREIRNQMSYFLSSIQNNKNDLSTKNMVADLLYRNSDFRFTKKFKDWKNEQLQDYVANLRLGKIRIRNSLYAYMVSCPYEMLVATTKENNIIDHCIMTGWECYCPWFDEGVELIGVRNPQINAGNILHIINKYHDEYKWFGYYDEDGKAQYNFVVFVNSFDVDLMNRAQGCDFDIDSLYLSDNELLVSKARESQAWPTPVNGIEGESGTRVYNTESLADLDNYLGGSTMIIGKIVNKSAIFNAHMYHEINNENRKAYIDACYSASSTLSSFSQIAIDAAKKNFKGLSLTKRMNELNKTSFTNALDQKEEILKFKEVYETDSSTGEVKIINKMIVPYFFKYIAKDNSYRIPTHMDCGMDYLQKILDELDTKAIRTDKVNFKDLLVMQKELDGGAYCGNKIDNVRRIIDNCQSIINQNIYCNTDSEDEAKQKSNIRRWAKKTAAKQLQDEKLNEKTVLRILHRAIDTDKNYKSQTLYRMDQNQNIITYIDWDDEEEYYSKVRELKEMTMLTLTLMYSAYPETFLKCFEEKHEEHKYRSYWI